MSDYGFAHDGKVFTPNATPDIDVADNAARNKAIEAAELKRWAGKPDRVFAYFSFPAESSRPGVRQYRDAFYPLLSDGGPNGGTIGAHNVAVVSTWLGTPLGTITSAYVYPHNFGGRFISLRVRGSNGAVYHGRASYDWGQCINLHRLKVREKRQGPRVRQTACRHCGLDIEGFSPYRRGEWRDRGNNAHCSDGRLHAPVKD